MRTLSTTLSLVLVFGVGQAIAQPTPTPASPTRLTPAEEAKLRDDVHRFQLEYSRFDDQAAGVEGNWTVSGSRTGPGPGNAAPAATTFSGELAFARKADGSIKVTGKVVLTGRDSGKWEGALQKQPNGGLTGTYKATIAGEGTIEFAPVAGGTFRMTFRSTAGPANTGTGTATRAVPMTRAQLEARLFELNARLQAQRYPRPTPVRYRTPSRKTEVRFTPSIEHDPNGVENEVIGMIDGARTSIDLAVFEFQCPRVAQALVRAKARGVKVRMVYDSREEKEEAIAILKRAQVPVRGDERSTYMHNKFMLIDGTTVWTGSTNLSPSGIYTADNNAIQFKSAPLAAEYTKEFEEMFVAGQFGTTSPANTSHEWFTVDAGIKVQVFFAPEDHAMDRLIEAVRGAKKTIRFMAFAYTSKSLFDAMVERMRAGVKVEGIFESRHAGWADIKIGPLKAAGADVRFDKNPNAFHHKVVVIDDKVVCTGSFNFSDGADTSNDENLLVIDNAFIARAYAREFAALLTTTDPHDPRIATSGMGGGTPATDPDADNDTDTPPAATPGMTNSVPH